MTAGQESGKCVKKNSGRACFVCALALGGWWERVIAYLFLPNAVEPTYQTVIYFHIVGAIYDESFDVLPYSDLTEFGIFIHRVTLATSLCLPTADRQEVTGIFEFIPGVPKGLVIVDLS